MLRPALCVVLVLALGVSAACTSDPPPEPAGGELSQARDTAVGPAVETSVAKAPVVAPEASTRAETGRDPFETAIDAASPPITAAGDGFALRSWLSGVELVGIVSETGVPRAMFVDGEGHGHIFTEGDLFRDGSRLTKISSGEVAFAVSPTFLRGGAAEAVEGGVRGEPEALVVRLHAETVAMVSPNSPLMR
jgi:hypothetical protein